MHEESILHKLPYNIPCFVAGEAEKLDKLFIFSAWERSGII